MSFLYRCLLLAAAAAIVAGEGEQTQPGGSKGNGKTGSPAAKPATAGGSSARGGQAGPTAADMENIKFYVYLATVLGATVAALLTYRVVIQMIRYIRTITCLSNDTQRYFALPNDIFAKVKQHVLYAPLFRKRHNSEATRFDLGSLPTRFQTMYLIAYFATNVAFCVVSIDWSASEKVVLAEFRNRTGIMAVVNMLPLFIMAGRNNPLIPMLNISFDTFNLMHRWFGRIVVIESVAHTAAYMVSKVHTSGWQGVSAGLSSGYFVLGGLLSTCAAVIILFQSPAVVRHAFYEVFLHLHIVLVLVFVIGLFLHLQGLPQMKLLIGAVVIWGLERTWRAATLAYRNFGRGGSKVLIETLPGDAMRITLDMVRPWTFRPGQHMFLYLPSVGLWTSHPFSIAWSEQDDDLTGEKGLAMNRREMLELSKTTMSLVVRRRTGFTDKLFKKAERAVDGKFITTAFAEGPYGGIQDLESYGTVLMFAGGVGITHMVPYVRQLVDGFANGTVATRKIVLVWVIQSPEHLEWIRPWMTTILAMDRRRDILRIQLFVTRPRSTKEIHSPSATVQMFPGRPNVETLIGMECQSQVGAMGVTVCGPGALGDDVRRAVRLQQRMANVDFIEESYSW